MGKQLVCNIEWEEQSFDYKDDVYDLLEECNTWKKKDEYIDKYWDEKYRETRTYQYETYILTDGRIAGNFKFGEYLNLKHEPFYVGCGKVGRHRKSMRLGRQLDKYCFKVKRMIEIIEDGGSIRPVIIGRYYTKRKAEIVEKKLMNTIPREYLQNSQFYLCEIPLTKADCNVHSIRNVLTI